MISAERLHLSADIYRTQRTAEPGGAWSQALAPVTSVSCYVRPASIRERLVADQLQAETSHVLYCNAPADVQRGDVVQIVSVGEAYEVIAVRNPGLLNEHLEVDLSAFQFEAAGNRN